MSIRSRLFHFPNSFTPPQVARKEFGAKSSKPAAKPFWIFSKSYPGILREGTQRPPPSFGTPTLVRHIGIWPRAREFDFSEASSFEDRIHQYNTKNDKFFSEINSLLIDVQNHGRVATVPLATLRKSLPFLAEDDAKQQTARPTPKVSVYNPQSITFTLWWQDEANSERLNLSRTDPEPSDLRVRVQAQSHLDYVTISFFIDVSKPWDSARLQSSGQTIGERRARILRHVEAVTQSHLAQLAADIGSRDRFPEIDTPPETAKTLLEAANDCFDQIWNEFGAAFGIGDLAAPPNNSNAARCQLGEVFADIRTIVLSTDRLECVERFTSPQPTKHQRVHLAPRNQELYAEDPSVRSQDGFIRFNPVTGEPNLTLKSFWPFIRRMEPGADDREFISCGVFGWRALFVSALGQQLSGIQRDESRGIEAIIPGGNLPLPNHEFAPVRQLIITKGEPHRQQIGRLVERVNTIGTLRLAALRNWDTIQAAGVKIRLLGNQLDEVLTHWSVERTNIGNRESNLKTSKLGRVRRAFSSQPVEAPAKQIEEDTRIEELNLLINDTEAELIQIGADLDSKIGQKGSGAMLYLINRSKLFTQEFLRLLDTLKVGNIETWVTYSQFVERGLIPIFDQIERTGGRLTSLRERLQSVTEMIQTGALIVQTQATEQNTKTLRKIVSNATSVSISAIGATSAIIAQSISGEKSPLGNLNVTFSVFAGDWLLLKNFMAELAAVCLITAILSAIYAALSSD
ncbi:MAG: hypothetical protein ABL973_20505 [Micropepsaceae bacterium]